MVGKYFELYLLKDEILLFYYFPATAMGTVVPCNTIMSPGEDSISLF